MKRKNSRKIRNLEKIIYNHLKERGWHKLRPGDIAKSIMIEGAELLELFQWHNPELQDINSDKEKMTEIKKELADVLIYGLEMAVLLKLDTEKIIFNKIEMIAKKYPAKLMSESNKGKPGTQSEYWKIKKEYRKNNLL